LSAQHDGISQGCKDEDIYIMSGSGKLTYQKRMNKWKFSNCSVKYFDDFIKQNLDSSKGAHCLYSSYNTSSEVPDVGTLMPGQVFDAKEQCRQLYGQSSYLCQNFQNWNLSMVCLGMWCSNGRRCSWGGFPARGTTCGDGMWCIDGQCQPNTSTSVMPSPTTTSPTTATTTTSITPTPTPAGFTTPAISMSTTPTTATTTAKYTTHTPSSTPTTTTTKRSTPSRSTTSSSSTTTTTSMEPSSTMASMEHSSMVPATPAATTTLPSSEATTTASLTSMTSTSAATDGSGCLTSSVALLVAGCIASLLTYLKHFVQ
ncbi:threonine-rich protein-like, partial [Littorina saxatilis]